MATYLATYQEWLEAQLGKGGAPAHMQACVDEYNAAGLSNYEPTNPLFAFWFQKGQTCDACRKHFIAVGVSHREILPLEVLCAPCREAAQIPAFVPDPGDERTESDGA